MKYLAWIALVVISALAGVISFQWLSAPTTPPPATSQVQVKTNVPISLFNIESSDGRFSHLSDDKKLYIAYFGFTHCPDVCPTSLAVLSVALQQVSEAQRQQLQSLFVSVDPQRDDPKTVSTYAGYFHQDIIGLSPQEGQLLGLTQALGVYYKYVETPNSELKYSVDHSSFFYFLNAKGELLAKVPHTLDPQPIIEKIRQLLP
ncbi:SCO family protein [Agarivorans sp. TSD2052]|uniref:SCO family protein n=1 Tax=Agarivorans sp. TSD2052 TaxID=2937286 RepID=UPI00200F0BF0|nr:SCO family protein [Agarivorans sp. TSD2052]UPW19275.1 SCO family protein [Agarivorans sp. TSD2052]